jgi:ferrous iron transport protein B
MAKRFVDDHAAADPPRRVAIVGLPNTGKSQLYNELTGDYALVANYPLTTVECKSRRVSLRGQPYELIDTPGLHSLYIHSEEEIAVRELLFGEPLQGLIQCVDANRLKQSLLLTLDLAELGLPLIIVLNAMEETEREGLKIDPQRLSAQLGAPVIEHAAQLNRGLEEIKSALSSSPPAGWHPSYGQELEARLAEVSELLPAAMPFAREKALLLLDGDPLLLGWLQQHDLNGHNRELVERLRHIRRESRGSVGRELARRRGELVDEIVAGSISRQAREPGRMARSLARLSRHPVFGIPILAGVIALVYLLVVRVAGWIEGALSALVVGPVVTAINGSVPAGFWNDLLVGPYGVLTLGLFNAFVTVLPILALFFLVMGLLEDSGYLPNLIVLTHRLLGRIGLSGRSVLSLVLGFGCKTMATLTTRGIPSRKERLITVFLIGFAIPCSAQLAINVAILGRVGFQAFLIAFATLALVEIGAGFVLNRIIKEDRHGDFIQELPPLRLPSPRALLVKTGYRIYWFLKEAVPIFLVAAVALFAADKIGLLGALKQLLKPIVLGWLGLPLNMVEVLILTMARHEAAAGLLLGMVDHGALSYVQAIVAVAITTMFVPCFANIVAMCRQMGVRTGLLITLAINVSSFVLAGILNWVLLLLGVGAP